MSGDSDKPKPRPRPRPRPPARPCPQLPEPATVKAPAAYTNDSSQKSCETRRVHRPAPNPPTHSRNSKLTTEVSKSGSGSLPTDSSGSSSTSPLSAAAKLAAMATEAEQKAKASGSCNSSPLVTKRSGTAKLASEAEDKVKAMSSLRNENDEPINGHTNPPKVNINLHDPEGRDGNTLSHGIPEPSHRPRLHPPNTSVLSRVSQKPGKLVIGQDSQKTLAVQYPGYTPTTPPDIDLVGGRLVRFAGGFEVSDTYASEEYDRRNRDSNPLFNSAEFELEKRVKLMDSYIIELKKEVEVGLGLSVSGINMSPDPNLSNIIMNMYVKGIKENGPAAKTRQIHVGDQIVEVDGHSLVGVSAKTAMQILRATGETVRLQLAREKSSVGEMTAMAVSACDVDHELEMLRKKNESLSKKVLTLEETKVQLERDLDKARRQLIVAHSQIEELNSAKEDAEVRIQTLEEFVSEQAAKCDAAESDKVEAAADAVTVWELLQEEQEEITRLREHITELEQRIAKKPDQSEIRTSIEDNNEIMQQLQVELEETTKQVTKWEDAYKSVRESRDQALQELETVQAALIAESEASKQAEEDVTKLDEAVISEQQRADRLQRHLADDYESLENEIATRKEQEVEHEKIVEAERLLRQKAERDLEVMKRTLLQLKSGEIELDSEEGVEVHGRQLTRAIPPTELLDVSTGKERSQLSSYSMRRKPSRYLLRRYAQEEEMAQHWKSIENHDDTDAIEGPEKEKEEDRRLEGPQSNDESTGVQVETDQGPEKEKEEDRRLEGPQSNDESTGVQVETDQGNDEVRSKPTLPTAIRLLPVGEAQTFPRARASTTVTRSTVSKRSAPIPPVRKSSISEEGTLQADTQEGEDEVDAAFTRSLTVSFAYGQSVQALGVLLNQQLSMRPSDVKKRKAPLPVPPRRPSTDKKSSVKAVESVSTGAVSVVGAGTILHDEQTFEQSPKRNLPELNPPLVPPPPSNPGSEQHRGPASDTYTTDEEKYAVQEVREEDNGDVVPDSEVVPQEGANNTAAKSRPRPPNRFPLTLLPQAFPPPPAGLPLDEAMLTVVDDHDISADSENLSETSCSSVCSLPLSPTSGDYTDTTQDASLPKPRYQTQVRTVLDWGQSEIRQWLELMKLEQYFPAFQEHGIQGSHLPDLDDTTLKAMGISSSHRAMLKKEAKVMRNQLEKHKKMEKQRADDEAKLEKKRSEEEAKMAKKRLKEEMKVAKKTKQSGSEIT